MTLPNFLVVGAARSGSTALIRFLGRHPEVFVAEQKEPSYFVFPGRPPSFTGPGDDYLATMVRFERSPYEALFSGAAGFRAIGEASVYYLHRPESFRLIDATLPQVRLIAIVRDPAERAFSAFAHMVREGRETETDFRRALAQEADRRAAGWEWNWEYVGGGTYADRVRRLVQTFGPERVLLLRHDDFERDPAATLRRAFRFLDVDPTVDVDCRDRVNPSGRPRRPRLHRFLNQPNRTKDLLRPVVPAGAVRRAHELLHNRNLEPLSLDPEVRAELVPRFHDDLVELERLTGWDLAAWRSLTGGHPVDARGLSPR